MDRNRKNLLKEIRQLLKGPQPDQTIVFFEGVYHLDTTLDKSRTVEIIPESKVKIILASNPDCRVHFIYLNCQSAPENITDDYERYEWLQEHPIEPDIPDIIQGCISPPDSLMIGVTSRKCAESLIDLITSGDVERNPPAHSKNY